MTVETLTKTCTIIDGMTKLPDNFKPGPKDVICKRGKNAYNHNQHFRDLIQSYLEKYASCSSKLEKSMMVSDVVDAIRQGSPEGGFVRCVNGVYHEVGDAVAREKVGGCFRDMLPSHYKSSTTNKRRRRQDQEDKKEEQVSVVESNCAKRRRMDPPATAFNELLNDIASRRKELSESPVTAPVFSFSIELKSPMLPPPARFPCSPRSAAFTRGCSMESMMSFDVNDMEEIDEFDVKLARFTSVCSAASALSFKTAV